MAAPKRSPAQRKADLATIAGLYLRGYSQSAIGKRLDISQGQVSQDLQKVYKHWRESAVMDFNEAKQRELARIDVLEVEAWKAWRRTIGKKEKTQTSHSDKDGKRASITKDDVAGDPRFLSTVQWCIEQRCKILGVYAAEKMAIMEVPYDELANTFDGRISGLVTRAETSGNPGSIQSTAEGTTPVYLAGVG